MRFAFSVLLCLLPTFAQAKSTLQSACEKQLKVAKPKSVCECLDRNLRKKISAKDLALLTKVYSGSEKAAAELETEKHQALQEFDMEVAEKCSQNPSWQIADSRLPKKTAPSRK